MNQRPPARQTGAYPTELTGRRLRDIISPSVDFQKSPSSDLIWRGTKTSRDFVARGGPLRGQARLAPLAKRSTCTKSTPSGVNKTDRTQASPEFAHVSPVFYECFFNISLPWGVTAQLQPQESSPTFVQSKRVGIVAIND